MGKQEYEFDLIVRIGDRATGGERETTVTVSTGSRETVTASVPLLDEDFTEDDLLDGDRLPVVVVAPGQSFYLWLEVTESPATSPTKSSGAMFEVEVAFAAVLGSLGILALLVFLKNALVVVS